MTGKKEFDGHDARANVCDESRTTVGKVDDKNAIVMMYDVDMKGMQKLMMSIIYKKYQRTLILRTEKCILLHHFRNHNN